MAQGYGLGWGDYAIRGYEAGLAQRDKDQAREERELGMQATKEKMEEERRVRQLEASRREALTSATQEAQAAGKDGAQVGPYDIYESAANRLRDAGDLDGYESFVKRADAARAGDFERRFADAYRKQDIKGALTLVNQFPDGVEYEVLNGDDGSVTTIARRDGQELGRKSFGSVDELFADLQSRNKAPDLYQRLSEARKRRLEEEKARATIDAEKEKTRGLKIGNDLDQKYGPQDREAGIRRTEAQTSASKASAAAGYANAEESKAGARLKGAQAAAAPTGDEAKRDRTAVSIMEAAARMAANHNKLHPYNPENHKSAEDFYEEAQRMFNRGRSNVAAGYPGAAKAPPPVVPGQASPGVPAAKDYSNLWK